VSSVAVFLHVREVPVVAVTGVETFVAIPDNCKERAASSRDSVADFGMAAH